ncbi:FecR family protein [Niabella beijingensis]|uniref:FecR family protein n=1 Tax=Niabella beijingensis TaxID=2872700 RepID=UPI001CBB7703|nr:FecR family protein [Niabella beijingensis]MBZ4190286.1 FecR family protein [Niabella beijingensis]
MNEGRHILINDQLIFRFFSGHCSEEEQEQVLSFFEYHPEALNHYLDPDAGSGLSSTPAPGAVAPEQMLAAVHHSINRKRTKRRLVWASGITTTVCVLFCFLFFYRSGVTPAAVPEVAEVPPARIEHFNRTTRSEHITLPDHSQVTLYSNSRLSYQRNFGETDRYLLLEGEADFNVEKDTSRPFIVEAGHIATKAVGTSFKVKATAEQITVKLFEGKVLVWHKTQGDSMRYYLTPHHQLEYTIAQNRFTASAFGRPKPAPVRALPRNTKQPQPANESISFRTAPLRSVLDQLAALYNIRIAYSSQDLEDIYIIADYSRKEPVEPLLKKIAMVNQLKLVKTAPDAFSISR